MIPFKTKASTVWKVRARLPEFLLSQRFATLKQESLDLHEHLCKASMALDRVSRFYGNPLYQASLDTAVTMEPGFYN